MPSVRPDPGLTPRQLAERLTVVRWSTPRAAAVLLDELVQLGLARRHGERYVLTKWAEQSFGAALRALRY